MNPAPLIFVELPSQRPRSASEFYTTVFGWSFAEVVPDRFYRAVTGALPNVGVIFAPEPPLHGTMTRPYFLVDDPAATIDTAVLAGATPIWEDLPLLELGWSSAFRDPWGLEIVAWTWAEGKGYDPRSIDHLE